jgi:hypothetical protein
MTTAAYLDGRFKYARPQAMLWATNPGTLVNDYVLTDATATLTSGSYSVVLTSGTTAGIKSGYNIVKTSGTGAFATTAKVSSVISSTEFTVTEPHTGSGSLTFNVGTYFYVPDGYEIGSSTANADDFLIISDHNRSPLDFSQQRLEKRERMINGRMRSYHIADKLTLSTGWERLPSRSHIMKPNFNSSTGATALYEYTVDGGAGGNELLNWYENHTGSFWVYLAYDKYTNFGTDDAAYGHLKQYNQIIEMFITDFSYSVEKRGQTNHDLWNISITLEEA